MDNGLWTFNQYLFDLENYITLCFSSEKEFFLPRDIWFDIFEEHRQELFDCIERSNERHIDDKKETEVGLFKLRDGRIVIGFCETGIKYESDVHDEEKLGYDVVELNIEIGKRILAYNRENLINNILKDG